MLLPRQCGRPGLTLLDSEIRSFITLLYCSSSQLVASSLALVDVRSADMKEGTIIVFWHRASPGLLLGRPPSAAMQQARNKVIGRWLTGAVVTFSGEAAAAQSALLAQHQHRDGAAVCAAPQPAKPASPREGPLQGQPPSMHVPAFLA